MTEADDDCFFIRSIRQWDKSDDRVGHLNTTLAWGNGNLNDPIFKCLNAPSIRTGGWGVGMLKFLVERISSVRLQINKIPMVI